MAKKFIISQAKMSKNIFKVFFALFIAFGLAACAKQGPQTSAKSQIGISDVLAEPLKNEAAKGLSAEDQEYLDVYDKACSPSNTNACMSKAGLLYQRGFYRDAAYLYDEICGKLQHIPACLALAQMFEKGIGVSQNKQLAKDIYERACYSGDKESCKKM